MSELKTVNIKDYYSKNNLMYMAIIELTNKCNYKCIHCFIDNKNCGGLDTESIMELLDELRKMGVYEIQFTGGEIFLREDILQIIEYARKLYFKVGLLTNASLLTDYIIEELNKMNVEVISTTLFSLKDDVNDRITNGNCSATKVLRNLEKIKNTNIRTEIKTVVMKQNCGQYRDIQNYCVEKDIEYLATEGIFPTFSGSSEPRKYSMTKRQLEKELLNLDSIRFNGVYQERKENSTKICCELHYSLFIDSKGDVYPCNLWFKKIGNVGDSSINEIWNCEFLNKIRLMTWEQLKECNDCEDKNFCTRCTGIVAMLTGDIWGKDTFSCRTAAIRRKLYLKNLKGGESNESV